jgi:acyl-CoA thioesterase YciA
MAREVFVPEEGEIVLQTVAMPKDANASGDIFGGWLLSQMDLGGSVLAHRLARNRIATVGIENMSFIKAVNVGDLVVCYGSTVKTGRSSITIKIDVTAVRTRFYERVHVAQGFFTYVALDDQGKSKAIDWNATV